MAVPILQWLVERGFLRDWRDVNFNGVQLSKLTELQLNIAAAEQEAYDSNDEGAAEIIENYNKEIRTIVSEGRKRN